MQQANEEGNALLRSVLRREIWDMKACAGTLTAEEHRIRQGIGESSGEQVVLQCHFRRRRESALQRRADARGGMAAEAAW